MDLIKALVVTAFLVLVILIYYITKFIFCYTRYEYWNNVVNEIADVSYSEIYSKYIMPFIASSETISISSNDKYFLEISQAFIDTFKRRSGKLWKLFTFCLYKNEEQLHQNILSLLIMKIQEDMINSITNNAKRNLMD